MGLLCSNSACLWDYCVLTLLTYKCVVCEHCLPMGDCVPTSVLCAGCLPANVLCANLAYLQIYIVLRLLTYKGIVC